LATHSAPSNSRLVRIDFGVESLKIILLSITAAVVYGIVHDQVTARICVEYFTIGHAPIFGTDDPTLLGVGWGILATWWVGLFLGVPLAVVARGGKRPPRSAASLVRPIAALMLVSALGAALAGLVGWQLASRGIVRLMGPLAENVPADRHVAFLIDGFAHTASYGCGFVGGLVVMGLVWRSRLVASTAGRASSGTLAPRGRGG
jgi:hypothetical protein